MSRLLIFKFYPFQEKKVSLKFSKNQYDTTKKPKSQKYLTLKLLL